MELPWDLALPPPPRLQRSPGVPAQIFKQSRASGVAKVSGRDLKAFPPELCNPDKYLESTEKAWTITLPVRVELGDNEIAVLPNDLSGGNPAFQLLKQLELRNNALTALPEGFWTLPQLSHLGLSGNPLGQLDQGVGQLRKTLTELDLSRTDLTCLPEALGTLSELVKLTLSHASKLKTLADSIGNLKKLKTLAVDHCALMELPSSIGGCEALKTLDVSFNKCKAVPPSVSSLTNLELLNLGSNRLVNAPVLPKAPNLLRVFLGHNRLVALDGGSLLNALNVQELLLNNNLLEELPPEVGALAKLRVLDFSCNSLQSVPTGLGYLPALQRVVYCGNPCEVRLGTRETSDLKHLMRTRGPPHPLLQEVAGVEVDDESNQAEKLYSKAKKLLAGGKSEEGAAAMAEAAAMLSKEDQAEGDQKQRELKLVFAAAVANRELCLSGKSLTVMPKEAAEVAPALHLLELQDNSLTVLDGEVLGKCVRLKVLNASQNKLGGSTTMAVKQGRGGNTKGAAAAAAAQTVNPSPAAAAAAAAAATAAIPGSIRVAPLAKLLLGHNQLDAPAFDASLTLEPSDVGPGEDHRLSASPLGLSLKELDLSYNRFRTLPPALLDLRSLVELNLAFNQLGKDAASEVPWPRLGCCTKLDLSNNKLEAIGSVPWMPSLEWLNLAHNEISRTPEELGASPTLKTVLIEGNCQRVINATVVATGGAAVKEWLERRLPSGYERPPHAHEAAAADDPPPAPAPPPSRRGQPAVRAEIKATEQSLKEAEKRLESAMSASAKATVKKEIAKFKATTAKLRQELTNAPP